jgi:hypothetical protein
MPYRSELQKSIKHQSEEKLMALQAQGLVQDCTRPGRAELRAGIKPFCVLKNYPSEPTRRVCPPCSNNSRRSSAYTSFLAKTGKDKIKYEILEDNIKILENKNKVLADANKEQFLQIEHYKFQLQNLQHQLEECRSSLNRAMYCYEIEYESNQHYKNL